MLRTYARGGEDDIPRRPGHGQRVVAFGGGHGLSAALGALRHVTDELTAVVTVADDGGSSGRLREEMNVIPPGDLRQALSALCEDGAWGLLWRDVLQHRFASDGPMDGHAMGNLMIVTLWQLLDDPVAGLDLVGRLLGARGRVLPMALQPLEIAADVQFPDVGTVRIEGQHKVAITTGRVDRVELVPSDAPAAPEALAAINEADWIVLGPGSFYTSVMPHLLLAPLRDAIIASSARRLLVLNLTSEAGETSGLSLSDHLRALRRHVPDMRFDVVLADGAAAEDDAELPDEVEAVGGILVVAHLAMLASPDRHDRLRLAAALQDIFDGAYGRRAG